MLNSHSLLPSAPEVESLAAGDSNTDTMSKEQAFARRALQALGKRVERLRRDKSWNRTTLAKKAGVTVATIRGCEEGTKVTQPDKLRLIATGLGMSVKRLVEGDETKDPRVRHWTDEDYEIGNWYHNAPRALKNRIWALQELADAGAALVDPQFGALLDGWSKLTQPQKNFVLSGFVYIQKNPNHDDDTGGVDALATADPKTRGPQR